MSYQHASNPAKEWERVQNPVQSGWSEDGLRAVGICADNQETDALMIVQSGKIIYTYGDIAHKYLCHSIRKSILAALMGQDVADGTIDLSLTLEQLGIDDNDGLSAVEKQATVYDLLTARSGIYHAAGYETPWMRLIKEKRHSHAPGTFWCYNNWDFNALGTIFEQLTGKTVHQAFDVRIAKPLQFEDFSLKGDKPDGWHDRFEESRHAAYPFRLSTRDLARFSQLYLRQGRWNGEDVLPKGWTQECVMPYSDAGARGAYGYMWWLERDGVFFPGVVTPKGTYAGFGAGGHFSITIPALDMVIVHRVDTDIAGRQLNRHKFGHLLKLIFNAFHG
ncbi:serine hydrolase domain-containing protein [Brucellaceae bacterium C25G]